MTVVKTAFVVFNLAFLLRSGVLGDSEQNNAIEVAETTKSTQPQNTFHLELVGYKCRDTYIRCNQEFCVKYGRRKMRRLCKKTCGYCRALSPPICFNSPYGCCWDYSTTALGPGGRGCPPCSDNQRYPSVCNRFKMYCRRKGVSGRWMRGNCPGACGHCNVWQF